MKEKISYDMYGKIKTVADIAKKALGKVDLDAKTLKPANPKKVVKDATTKVSKNPTMEQSKDKVVNSKVLKKPAAPKKANVKETKAESLKKPTLKDAYPVK